MKGKIFLLPNLLGEDGLQECIPAQVQNLIVSFKNYIVEDIRNARRYLKSIDKTIDIDSLAFFEMNKRIDNSMYSSYLKPCLQGEDMALLSEAGVPCMADPGSIIVSMAHQNGIRVVPLVGPSSVLLALIASGLNGQNFAFNGYLPVRQSDRIKKIKELEARSFKEEQSQFFMETPYRNEQLVKDVLNACRGGSLFTICLDITQESEQILTRKVSDWKSNLPDMHKRPAIFGIQAQ